MPFKSPEEVLAFYQLQQSADRAAHVAKYGICGKNEFGVHFYDPNCQKQRAEREALEAKHAQELEAWTLTFQQEHAQILDQWHQREAQQAAERKAAQAAKRLLPPEPPQPVSSVAA